MVKVRAGRTNTLVCLLSVLHLGLVDSWLVMKIFGSELRGDLFSGAVQPLFRHRRRICTHVGNEPILVELLRGLHCFPGSKSELGAAFLLECARYERGIWAIGEGLLVDSFDDRRLKHKP